MKIKTLSKVLVFLLSAVLLVGLGGCNLSEKHQNDGYVASVKELVNECINQNRILTKQDESFNCHDAEKSKEYIGTMDNLSITFQKLLQLQPTTEFAKYHEQITSYSALALANITNLRTLASYAAEHEDDTLYQNDKAEIMDEYKSNCDLLRSLSSEIQTYWRNA